MKAKRDFLSVAGFVAHQWEDDERNGQQVAPNGRRLAVVYLGPVLAYDIPAWKATVKAKAQFPVYLRNSLNTTRLFLVLTKAFQ